MIVTVFHFCGTPDQQLNPLPTSFTCENLGACTLKLPYGKHITARFLIGNAVEFAGTCGYGTEFLRVRLEMAVNAAR